MVYHKLKCVKQALAWFCLSVIFSKSPESLRWTYAIGLRPSSCIVCRRSSIVPRVNKIYIYNFEKKPTLYKPIITISVCNISRIRRIFIVKCKTIPPRVLIFGLKKQTKAKFWTQNLLYFYTRKNINARRGSRLRAGSISCQ